MNKRRRDLIATNQISTVREYTLGGHRQRVALDGKHAASPLLLTLHGGPGTPFPFSVGCRGLFPQFSAHFIMVYWDQLGCGANNYPLKNDFSVHSFADMGIDLIKALRQDFPQNPLFLLGTSWGSVLAANAAIRVPQLIDGVVAYGQVVKQPFFNAEVYAALGQAALRRKEKARLAKIRAQAQHTPADWNCMVKWIRKYTDGYQAKSELPMRIGHIFMQMLASPDYSLKDFIALFINGYAKNTRLLQDLLHIDLSDTLEQMPVPYFIVQGSTDIVSSTKTLARLVAQSGNANLRYMALENNGHIPDMDGLEKILAACRELAAL